MDCKYFKELLSAYIDNYIKQNEKLELEEHLLKCNNCKEYLNKLKNYKDNLKNFEELDAPIGFEKKVMRKIEEKEKAFIWFFGKRFILEFSAFLIVFVSLLLVYLNIEKPKEKITPPVLSEEIIKKEKDKIELKEKKEDYKKQRKEEKLELQELKKTPIEQKKEKIAKPDLLTVKAKKEEEKKKNKIVTKQEELEKLKEIPKEEIAVVAEQPAPIIIEEKKETEADFSSAQVLPIPEYDITIKISEKNFKDAINKIEEILKNEKIDFKKIKVNENREEIFMPSKDLKNIMEKISNIEGVKIENYKSDEIINNKEIKIELLKD